MTLFDNDICYRCVDDCEDTYFVENLIRFHKILAYQVFRCRCEDLFSFSADEVTSQTK